MSGSLDYPRVTEILKAVGLVDGTWHNETARDRGTAVHLACLYEQDGSLDESTVDPAVAPYLDAWRLWRREMPCVIEAGELPVVNKILCYRGTLDLVLIREDDQQRTVADIKTGPPADWHAVQLAAYDMALPGGDVRRRAGLYLRNDGTYRWVSYTDRDDYAAWRAALTLFHWRRSHES